MAGKKNWFVALMDKFAGDKLVLIILLLLMMISALCIFSSTSQLPEVLRGTASRTDVMFNHFKTIGMGLAVIAFIYSLCGVKTLRLFGRLGFITSAALLLFLAGHLHMGPISAAPINGAWRVIKIGGFQFHVFEFVKVAMVLYLAYAIENLRNGGFSFLEIIADRYPRIYFIGNETWKKIICIYCPMGIIFILVAMGSVTSSLFIALVMFLTIWVGGLNMRELFIIGGAIAVLGIGIYGTYKMTDGAVFSRLETAESRLESFDDKVQRVLDAKPKSQEYYKALGAIEQQYGSRIAIKEGGLFGKGAGGSSQKYKVSVMFEDFMFSFVVEEYGLFGAMVLFVLFSSLIMRGSLIARNCGDTFPKVAVAGLVLLISGQAYLHMFVNTGIFPMTGQTLPLISHGRFAFLMFSAAFGIILSISKTAEKSIAKEIRDADPLIESRPEVDAGMEDLDALEENLIEN